MTAPGRLLYLDALRGALILYIILLHALGGIVAGNNPEAASSMNFWVFLAVAPLAIIATWAPLFALISGTANAYVMHHRLAQSEAGAERDALRRSLLVKGLKVSGMLYVLSLLNMTLMHHSMLFNGERQYTLLTGGLELGQWLPLHVDLFFFNDALGLISVSIALTTLVLYFLWRGEGIRNDRRTMTVCAAIAATVFVLAPLLHRVLDPVYFNALNSDNHLLALALKFVVAPGQSPAPNLAFAFVGVIFGVALARNTASETLLEWGYRCGATLLAVGLGMLAVQGFSPADLVTVPFPMKLHTVNLGTMILLNTWLISKMEMCGEARRAQIAGRTVLLRRIGMVALSIFLLESFVATLFGRMFSTAFGESWTQYPVVVGLFILTLYAFWLGCVRRWERVNFRYGFEWLTIRITRTARGAETSRLDAQRILYNAK